jgi:hypothetical protein
MGPTIQTTPHLGSEDRIVLYPTTGRWDEQRQGWRVAVAGFIYKPGIDSVRGRIVVRILKRLLRATDVELRSDIFRRRIAGFLVDSRRGQRVIVRIGGETHVLKRKSRRSGHFHDTILVAPQDISLAHREILSLVDSPEVAESTEVLRNESVPANVAMHIASPRNARTTLPGYVHLLSEVGLSVISDIDDTIKISDVGQRDELLRNTFLRDFHAVPGMAELYSRWARAGVAFHYVSSSPWQLYDCLASMLRDAGFPSGSMHLRHVRLRDPSVLRLFIARKRSKRREIRGLLQTFPHRRFVLVGDSGESDPEIYGGIARKYPERISAILIRRVKGRPLTPGRCRRAFRELRGDLWMIFEQPGEIESVLSLS